MTYSTKTKSSNHEKHIPLRSCTVCRAKSGKSSLIRIVKSPDGRPVIDTSKKLPGRGAYICPDPECIEKGVKSGSLAHFLGTSVNDDFRLELLEHAKSFGINIGLKVRSVLGLSRKSGALIIGTDNIERESRKVLVMTASDCSESVRKFAESYENIALDMNIEELSSVIGSRGSVQIVGLPLASGFAKKLTGLNIVKGENAV
ncbi:MAG: YlxR family protein [Synergistaceae bacterium]|nr:YlxR family protein [Synergistaceae bacterium]